MRVYWPLLSDLAQDLGWGWDELGSLTRIIVRLGWWWSDEDDGRSGAVERAWFLDYNILLHVLVVNELGTALCASAFVFMFYVLIISSCCF